jgi:hypothetical protein
MLMQHNCFGLVKVNPNEIIVTVSAITEKGLGLTRGYGLEVERDMLPQGSSVTATFAAMIQPGERNRISFHDLAVIEDLPLVGELPEVPKAVTKALDLIKIAVWPESQDSKGQSK